MFSELHWVSISHTGGAASLIQLTGISPWAGLIRDLRGSYGTLVYGVRGQRSDRDPRYLNVVVKGLGLGHTSDYVEYQCRILILHIKYF